MILGCKSNLRSCYTTEEIDAIVDRHRTLLLSALVAIIPTFDHSRLCNDSIAKTIEKPLANLSSDNSTRVSPKEFQDLNSSKVSKNATSPIKIGKLILNLHGFKTIIYASYKYNYPYPYLFLLCLIVRRL